ncbi:MAG TPA: G1 family glutamic endopeptidase [Streptosporangiaceae bacterium]|jgi:hypothetical protein
MRHHPHLLSGLLAACAVVAVMSVAAAPAGAAVPHSSGPHSSGHQAAARAAAARQARAIAVTSIRRMTARWRHDAARPADGSRVTPATPITSTSWGGYADISETFSKVGGKWAQPTITCSSSTTAMATWVGFDGFSDGTVEQAGTLAECYEHTAYYYSWWEMYPTDAVQVEGETVAAGDAITGSISRSGTAYTLKVTDATHTANSFSTTQTCAGCASASAEWIAGPTGDSGVGLAPITWTLTNATVTAGSVSGVISTFPYNRIVPTGGSTSSLNAAGNSFTVIF